MSSYSMPSTSLLTRLMPDRSSANKGLRLLLLILRLRIFLALIAVMVFFSSILDSFLVTSNLLIMAEHITIFGILAVGMTPVILSAGIDLSVGSIVGFAGMAVGFLIMEGIPFGNYVLFLGIPSVIVVTCIIGVAIGLVNAFLITYLNVVPFIATLGMLYVIRGSALLTNGGSTFASLGGYEQLGNTGFYFLGSGEILGIGTPVWILVVLTVVTVVMTKKTPLGRYIYAIGGNESAAIYSGLPVRRVKFFVYAFSGLCAALVGLIITSQLGTAHPLTGQTFELSAIAAVVLGGTALFGGRGSVIGSVVGAAVISILSDGMVMSGVSNFWQKVIMGMVIIIAVVIDQAQQRLEKRVLASI